MKIGDEVEIVKEVTYEGGKLNVGTKGLVGNIAEEGGEQFVAFVIESPFQVFVLKASSVQ